jgi:hypothetical protein
MGGLGFLGSGCCSMGRRIGLGELGEELCEWDSLWVDLCCGLFHRQGLSAQETSPR